MKLLETLLSFLGIASPQTRRIRDWLQRRNEEDAELRALAPGRSTVVELPDDLTPTFRNFGQRFEVTGLVVRRK